MRLIAIFFMLLLASVAMAQDGNSETTTQENWTAFEVLAYAQPKNPIRQCMENCVAFYEPGPELRHCVADCQKIARANKRR